MLQTRQIIVNINQSVSDWDPSEWCDVSTEW